MTRRLRLKVWRLALSVELSYRKGQRSNKQIREDRERYAAAMQRFMDAYPSGRAEHRNHVHIDLKSGVPEYVAAMRRAGGST